MGLDDFTLSRPGCLPERALSCIIARVPETIPSKAPLLNPEQALAVSTTEGPVLILAGAGSGKTRVITYRIAGLLEKGVPQSSILALTFTNKAAREMSERVRHITGKPLKNLTVSTFHAFGVQVLRSHIEVLGYRPNFSIYDSADQMALIRNTLAELKLPAADLDLYRIQNAISKLKTRRASTADYESLIGSVYAEYQEQLKLYNSVDFDDLIQLPIQLFENHPDILEKYRTQYRYIMVDEFQDTSHSQYHFVSLMAKEHRNFCVVGDDDQSIYSWRGANFKNLEMFEHDFPERLEIKLEQNYRSTGTIIEAANSVILKNKQRKAKKLWTGGGEGRPIDLYIVDDEAVEARLIAQSIRELAGTEGVKYQDIGILIRTNSLSRNIEEELLSAGIPYRMSGGTSFFQRQEIKDIIAYLRTITNHDDDISLLRILNTPRRGIGKKSLELIDAHARRLGSSIHGAMRSLVAHRPPEASASLLADIEGFLELIESYRPKFLSGKKLADNVRQLVADIDYWSHLVSEFQKNEQVAKWRLRNLELFAGSVEDYEKNPDNIQPSIFAYLNRISLSSSDDDDSDSGKVHLMTIHSAKGLEYDVIFLAGADDEIIPHKRALTENEENEFEMNLEEERRLFYVAITRARKKLVVSTCRERRILREKTECRPSPFLEEIPESLMQVHADFQEKELSVEEAESMFARIRRKFSAEDGT